MKIGWNVLNCGLGNNGGSKTIILCNKTLNNIGHESVMISRLNTFNWFNYPEPLHDIPSGLDAIISIQHSNVTDSQKSDAKKKAWYIRSFLEEVNYDAKDVIKIVNSNNLKKRVSNSGVNENDIHVIPQGIDFDWWENLNLRDKSKTRIGCLYNIQPKKNWKDFAKLTKHLDASKFEFVGFGTYNCADKFLSEYLLNPSREELVKLYSSCDIWFAPTESEGLHNVPMEAALCGCLIICGNHKGNGMLYDYAFPNKTSMIYEDIKEAVEMIKNPNYNLIEPMEDCLRTNIGTRENAMAKLVNLLEDENV